MPDVLAEIRVEEENMRRENMRKCRLLVMSLVLSIGMCAFPTDSALAAYTKVLETRGNTGIMPPPPWRQGSDSARTSKTDGQNRADKRNTSKSKTEKKNVVKSKGDSVLPAWRQ